jgi:hypothetical protein
MNKDIERIFVRNKRVELDKSWEISKTRRFIIALLTYLVILLFLYSIKIPKPWLNAIVPTIGFILSTLTLSFFKKIWIKKYNKD